MTMLLVFAIFIIGTFANSDVINAENRIVQGNPAVVGQFPWMVAITVTRTQSSGFCGGALIHDNFVLTAARCVAGDDVARLSMDFGGITLGPVEVGRISFPVLVPGASIIVHPYYNPNNIFSNDIALIRMFAPMTVNQRIRTIALPAINSVLPQNTPLLISGWGREHDHANGLSLNLRWTNLTSTTLVNCVTVYPSVNTTAVVCAAGYPAATRNICHGDFGGPLIQRDQEVLVGIASFTHQNGCGSGNPAGFTRVGIMVEWIQHEMKLV